DDRRTLRAVQWLKVEAVTFCCGPMHVRQQPMLEIHGIRPSLMREEAVAADTEEFRVRRLKLGEIVGQTLILALTTWTPIQRVEAEHDILLAAIVAELHILLILIF